MEFIVRVIRKISVIGGLISDYKSNLDGFCVEIEHSAMEIYLEFGDWNLEFQL